MSGTQPSSALQRQRFCSHSWQSVPVLCCPYHWSSFLKFDLSLPSCNLKLLLLSSPLQTKRTNHSLLPCNSLLSTFKSLMFLPQLSSFFFFWLNIARVFQPSSVGEVFLGSWSFLFFAFRPLWQVHIFLDVWYSKLNTAFQMRCYCGWTDEGLHCNYCTMLLSVEAAHCFWFCYCRDHFCLGTLVILRFSYSMLILLPANKAL